MSITLRIPQTIHAALLEDLRRPHTSAGERVAFCFVTIGNRGGDPELALVTDWWSVPDEQYIDDPSSGARINSVAIRSAMQRVLDSRQGVLHVHLHDLEGLPEFGHMDNREIPRLIDSFHSTNPHLPHGRLLLSSDSATADVALPGDRELHRVDQVSLVGTVLTIFKQTRHRSPSARFQRQSFLGPHSETIIANTRVGVIGLGGGGSHIAQQLAHLGFGDLVFYDEQTIDDTNLNRLIGATEEDVFRATPKVEIAARLVRGIRGSARIQPIQRRWQDEVGPLRSCDIAFGCLDRFDQRRELEATCRRYLIPLIDIGMDVHGVEGQPPRLAGQVIMSLPGGPCMHCINFLSEQTMAREAQGYGVAGDRPQVVWSNGVLASNAVGLGINLLTQWSGRQPAVAYLSYDGNVNTLVDHVRLRFLQRIVCPHYRLDQLGDPLL